MLTSCRNVFPLIRLKKENCVFKKVEIKIHAKCYYFHILTNLEINFH